MMGSSALLAYRRHEAAAGAERGEHLSRLSGRSMLSWKIRLKNGNCNSRGLLAGIFRELFTPAPGSDTQDQTGTVSAMSQRIVCFGDSNTYGYDPRSYLGGQYPASVRWTSVLKIAGWEIVNERENGRCIPQRRQDADVLSHAIRRTEAKMAVIMLGDNDLLQRPGLRQPNGTIFDDAFRGNFPMFHNSAGRSAAHEAGGLGE